MPGRIFLCLLCAIVVEALAAHADVQECRQEAGKLVCRSADGASSRIDTLLYKKWTARVLRVLDTDLLEVDLQGTRRRIRFLGVVASEKADVEALITDKDIQIYAQNIEADGALFSEVWLLSGQQLRQAIGQSSARVKQHEASLKNAKERAEKATQTPSVAWPTVAPPAFPSGFDSKPQAPMKLVTREGAVACGLLGWRQEWDSADSHARTYFLEKDRCVLIKGGINVSRISERSRHLPYDFPQKVLLRGNQASAEVWVGHRDVVEVPE